MRKWLLIASMFAVFGVQAAELDPVEIEFENSDFEANGENSFPDGFNASPDVIGWEDDGSAADAGIEDAGAWWGTHDGYSAFMNSGDSAWLPSEYVIRAGDEFFFSFYGKSWDGDSQWTVHLFYGDDPENVIGEPVEVDLPADSWEEYTSGEERIASSSESVGETLGIYFENTGSGFANLDDVHVFGVSLKPKPALFIMKR